MRKLILAALMSVVLLADQAIYNMAEDASNSYFRAISDVLFMGNDEIVGVNKNPKGSIVWDDDKIQSGKIVVLAGGFDTQNSMRDKRIRQILSAEQNPEIVFVISSHYQKDNQAYLDGVLTINKIDQKQTIPVVIVSENDTITIQGKTTIKYSDFGIKNPSMGGFIKKAKDEIEIGGKFLFHKGADQ